MSHPIYYQGKTFQYNTIDTGCAKKTLDFARFANAATGMIGTANKKIIPQLAHVKALPRKTHRIDVEKNKK